MPTTDERLKQIEIVALKEEGDLPENMSMSENMFYEEMHCLYASSPLIYRTKSLS